MKKYLTLLILIFTLNIFAVNNQKWTPIKFIKKGTKRLINKGHKKYYFYRPEKEDFLSAEIKNQKIIKIEIIEKNKRDSATFTIAIDNVARKYTVSPKFKNGKYWIFNPLNFNLSDKTHLIRINTNNRNLYFRIFRKSKRKISTKSFRASKSKGAVFVENIASKKRITFFKADAKNPVIYTLTGGQNEIIGYAKSILNQNKVAKFNIIIDEKKIKTIIVPQKTSKKYLMNKKTLTQGKKFKIKLTTGKHILKFQPLTDSEIFFRLNK